MKKAILFACLTLCGCVTNRTDPTYNGADSGAVVFAAGLTGTCEGFSFEYRNLHPQPGLLTSKIDGRIMYSSKSIRFWGRKEDFSGEESGIVTIHHLEPGEYELYTFTIYGTYNGIGHFDWFPQHEFSLKFTVTPGKAIYLGDFNCVGQTQKNFLGFEGDAGGYFVISDKHDRDLPIAQKQEPNLPPPALAVPDVDRAGEPTLRSRKRY